MERGEKMVDDELNWSVSIEQIKKLKEEENKEIKEITVILAEKFENKKVKEKFEPIEVLIQKARADENPQIDDLASDILSKIEAKHEKMKQYWNSAMETKQALDKLQKILEMKEEIEKIEKRNMLSTMSFSNVEKVTDKKKEETWLGGKNE